MNWCKLCPLGCFLKSCEWKLELLGQWEWNCLSSGYVNSLLQTLFHAEEFRNQVLHFEYEPKPSDATETTGHLFFQGSRRGRRYSSLYLLIRPPDHHLTITWPTWSQSMQVMCRTPMEPHATLRTPSNPMEVHGLPIISHGINITPP